MPHYVLRLSGEFAYERYRRVQADEQVAEGNEIRFVRDGRTVYRTPADYVTEVLTFDTDLEAREWESDARRAPGAASFAVQEYRAARRARAERPQGGFLAETITVSSREKDE